MAGQTHGPADLGIGYRPVLPQNLRGVELPISHDPRPASLAARRPGCGGSLIRPRSYSANAPNIGNTSLPIVVAVSICSVSETDCTPWGLQNID